MRSDLFYSSAFTRALLVFLQKIGVFRFASSFLKTRASRFLIPRFIKKNGIDMTPFEDHEYNSFAEFFSRKKDVRLLSAADGLISPCDGLLSVFEMTQDLELPLKDSVYVLTDIIPDSGIAEMFRGGLCLVFRLEASDYHHFCFIDDGEQTGSGYSPGLLHSVQPVALRSVPVFRLNRRWWNLLETEHLGPVLQAEIGAVLVGGVTFFHGDGPFRKGEDMGCFELAGSTVLIFLNSDVRERLSFSNEVMPAFQREEVRVRIGETIGTLKN